MPKPPAIALTLGLVLAAFCPLGAPFTHAAHAAEEDRNNRQGPTPGKTPAEPSAQPADRGEDASLPFIEISREKRHVDVEGEVCLREGMLELVATIRGGKEHESVFRIDARPRHLHFALLTLGLEPGQPGRWRYENDKPEPIDPTGDPVRITVRYENADEERVEHPISRFVRDRDSGDAMDETRFVFAGSRIKKGMEGETTYMADSSGDVVSLVSFNDELLALPTAASNANEKLVWEANTPAIPPAGTAVILRIRPAEPPDDGENRNNNPGREQSESDADSRTPSDEPPPSDPAG